MGFGVCTFTGWLQAKEIERIGQCTFTGWLQAKDIGTIVVWAMHFYRMVAG
jgi:hypothetical protein